MAQTELDFSTYIAEHTQNFTGRNWVFKSINDWLVEGKNRIFLLTGGPGEGKSAIATRLAQISDGIVTDTSDPEFLPNWLTYYHFCQFGLEDTLSPLTFVQSLSEALANRYPKFRNALESIGSKQININTIQDIGTLQSGGQVTGVKIKIEIIGGDARPMFDQVVRRPLKELSDQLPSERIIILIDSLDEALTFNTENNIAQLLKLVADFPPQVRFICTCRSMNETIIDIIGEPSLDLIKNAPSNLDEVKLYAVTRLKSIPEPKCSDLADVIAKKSNGNFLYAHHVINDLLANGDNILDYEKLELPDELEDVYRKFIEREMATSRTKWNDTYRPLLGLIAVSRGNGLTRKQLVNITSLEEDTASEVLKVCKQYLVSGQTDDTRYRIYHQSFRDFLLEDEKYTVYPAVRHAAIAYYLQEKYGSNWRTCNDEYALRYTPTHWAEAAAITENKRESRTQALIEIIQNQKYQRAFEQEIGDIPTLKEHFYRAVQVAALNNRDDMLPWLIKAAKGYVTFQREYLNAESVVKLADDGKLEQADARLQLISGIDDDWHLAARLIIIWLGSSKNPIQAKNLFDQICINSSNIEPLPLLNDRINAVLNGKSFYSCPDEESLSLEFGYEIIKRISGQEFNRELLGAVNSSLILRLDYPEMISQSGYASVLDAPILVEIAKKYGLEGTALVDDYIQAHASYNYIEYRNRSLWIVLRAILLYHPDQDWVKERIRKVLLAVLAGGGVDFCELLPLTLELIKEQNKNGNLQLAIKEWSSLAFKAVNKLRARRNGSDTWGIHKRRLTGLMELYTLLLDDSLEANSVLKRIRNLPYGFAGYQAPAYLRLADALFACGMNLPDLSKEFLEEALQSAHHIQDYHFCARITARCNALKRWHISSLKGLDLSQIIVRFVKSPSDGEFSTVHLIHEDYQYRDKSDPDILPIFYATRAETLDQLTEVFQISAVDFRRLNPQYGLTQIIEDQSLIRVPDPGFAPLLAVHLGARVIGDKTLENERGEILRSLVPIAANNPTALDTLLSYLLIASQPDDAELLEELVQETGPVIFADVTPSAGQLGPDALTPV